MQSVQYIDYNKLREGFIERSRSQIPPELHQYEKMWEASAKYFFDLFIKYIHEQGLELRFRLDVD